jgi:phage terminase small subunit
MATKPKPDTTDQEPSGLPPRLPPRQERFCREYVIDLNATQAAIRAGYSAKTADVQGPRLLGNVRVAARIAELQEVIGERVALSADWVVHNLRSVAERCMQAQRVTDGKGRSLMVNTPTGELAPAYIFNANGANKALELLGRHLGIFKEDNSQKVPLQSEAQRLATVDAEIEELMSGGDSQPGESADDEGSCA